jgi:hypothetical protein
MHWLLLQYAFVNGHEVESHVIPFVFIKERGSHSTRFYKFF